MDELSVIEIELTEFARYFLFFEMNHNSTTSDDTERRDNI